MLTAWAKAAFRIIQYLNLSAGSPDVEERTNGLESGKTLTFSLLSGPPSYRADVPTVTLKKGPDF